MQPLEIKYNQNAKLTSKKQAQASLGSTESFEQLIQEWLKVSTHEVHIYQAIDDDPAVEYVCLILCVGKEEVVEIYYGKKALRKLYPLMVPISNLISKFGNKLSSKREEFQLEKQLVDKYHDKLGFEYNDAVCSQLGPTRALIPYIIPYTLSDGGAVSIQNASHSYLIEGEDILEELKQDGLKIENLLCIFVHYQSPKVTQGMHPGFGTSAYIRTDSDLPLELKKVVNEYCS